MCVPPRPAPAPARRARAARAHRRPPARAETPGTPTGARARCRVASALFAPLRVFKQRRRPPARGGAAPAAAPRATPTAPPQRRLAERRNAPSQIVDVDGCELPQEHFGELGLAHAYPVAAQLGQPPRHEVVQRTPHACRKVRQRSSGPSETRAGATVRRAPVSGLGRLASATDHRRGIRVHECGRWGRQGRAGRARDGASGAGAARVRGARAAAL